MMVKIQRKEAIHLFFERCENNVRRIDQNRFLGLPITKEKEKQICRQLKKAGIQEFDSDESQWPSLFVSAREFSQRPYQQNIRLDLIRDKHFRYTKEILPAKQLFNSDAIQLDSKRELNDWLKLRALDDEVKAAVLWQDDDVWMLDAPSEANTIDPCAAKAKGNVLTFGLGIGYFIYMAINNPAVKSITVVEASLPVIAMFRQYLLPQFPSSIPLQIVHGDAYQYFEDDYISSFDYIFVDIHKSNDDGLMVMRNMLKQAFPPVDQLDFWIEDSCIEIMPTLIYRYLKAISLKGKWASSDPYIHELLKEIHHYFSQMNETIDNVDHIKHLMYDRKVIRQILGHQDPNSK